MLTTDDAVTDLAVTSESDLRRWIIGIDGSACASNAVRWVVANAPGRATSLELLTAWQAPTIGAYPMSSPSVTAFDDSELIAAAADETEAVAAALPRRPRCSRRVVRGQGRSGRGAPRCVGAR